MESANAVRRALVRNLSVRAAEIASEITQVTQDKIEKVRVEGVDHERIDVSTRAHHEALMHLLGHPDDLDSAEAPVGAVSVVRELARRGFPLHEIIRSYQLSSARWYQICSEVLVTLTDDIEVLGCESIAVSKIASGYLDRMCERMSAEYEDERQRWLRQEESGRLDRVLALLAGGVTEADDCERALGYRLRQQHLALIAWVDADDSDGEELMRAQRAVAEAAGRLEGRGRPFVVARDSRTVWAWVPQPVRELSAPDVRRTIASVGEGVRLALGDPASGIAGFAQSHRQAAAAYDVGRVSTVATVFPYSDVSALAFLVAQPQRAQVWMGETLGQLASGARREDVLRETLRVYLRSHQSATTTSRELNCHKNTVLYRIRLIERLLGRGIDSDPTNIGLALQAHKWLGSAFAE
ncbi:PucR family transcriptional regulator [Streptomyces sp. NPDC017991]|uniref:PucR family transcriptional regulator n=1 Tax=Streptomyces sp. NPDC017991 TaxID=3365026 RepID=UPI0037B4306E